METQAKFKFTAKNRFLCLLIGLAITAGGKVNAQELFYISSASTMKIEGTSTLHDWTSTIEKIRGEGQFIIEENALQQVADVKIIIDALSIKSGNGALMDKNMYKALQAEQYPTIQYVLQTIKILPDHKLMATGKLTVAGVSKTVIMPLTYRLQSAARLSIAGELPLLLRNYNIDPPVAMMGTIRTGEEVKISFNVVFVSEKQLSSLLK